VRHVKHQALTDSAKLMERCSRSVQDQAALKKRFGAEREWSRPFWKPSAV
jgi:hypothetical protein